MSPEQDDGSSRSPERKRSEQGGSFAELMLATLIVGTTVVGASTSLSETAEVYHYFTDGPHDALMLAQEIHEAATQLPWDDDAGDNDFTWGDADTLWDMDGSYFSPPKSAGFEEVVSHPNWSQYVRVYHVDLDDPTVIVDPTEFEGETLVQLRVWVWSPSFSSVEGFTWWMSEPEDEL